MAKGGQFEIVVCKMLSAWWQNDPDADTCFWRTSQSGGRATNRAKTGRKTHQAHCGDISALDESAAVLTRLITFEVKAGYSAASLHALLDRRADSAEQIYEKWIKQAQASATAAGTPYWAIIHKRNGREITMLADYELFVRLKCFPGLDFPWFVVSAKIPGRDVPTLLGCCFEAFLDVAKPKTIRELVTGKKKDKIPSPI